MSQLFNTTSRFVIVFLPRSKYLLILWLQSPSTMVLEPRGIKSVTVSTLPPSICHEVMGLDAMILVFWMLSFKPTLSHSSFTLIKRLFSSSSVQSSRSVVPNSSDPMDCSTPGLPVHHQLPEFTQIHVHWVGAAIQPSHPLWAPSPPAFNLSQPLHLPPIECYHLHIWGYWYFSWQSWFQLVLHPVWHFSWCTLHIS